MRDFFDRSRNGAASINRPQRAYRAALCPYAIRSTTKLKGTLLFHFRRILFEKFRDGFGDVLLFLLRLGFGI